MKAEIRAIKKLEFAQEVYDQKLEEQRRLLEVILEAEVKVGDLTIEMNNYSGMRTDLEPLPVRGKRLEKTKKETIQELGFSTSQVGRFEKMAKNPDIVNEVIADSKAGKAEATQGEVLRRIKERDAEVVDISQARRRKYDQDMRRIDTDYQTVKQFRDAVYALLKLPDDSETVRAMLRGADGDASSFIQNIDDAIGKLTLLKTKIRTEKRDEHYSKG